MFGIAALIVFILALFKVQLGDVDLVVLGLALLTAHVVLGAYVPVLPARRRE